MENTLHLSRYIICQEAPSSSLTQADLDKTDTLVGKNATYKFFFDFIAENYKNDLDPNMIIESASYAMT
jgi:hypothetical protein